MCGIELCNFNKLYLKNLDVIKKILFDHHPLNFKLFNDLNIHLLNKNIITNKNEYNDVLSTFDDLYDEYRSNESNFKKYEDIIKFNLRGEQKTLKDIFSSMDNVILNPKMSFDLFYVIFHFYVSDIL